MHLKLLLTFLSLVIAVMPLFRKRKYGASLGTGSVASGGYRRSKRFATAASNRRNITKNTTKINRMIKLETVYTTFQAELRYQALVHQNTWWLTDPSTWVQRFGPTPGPQAMLTKVEVDMQIIPANEPSAITYTIYVVSLKKETSAQLLNNKGNGLITLDQTVHFVDTVQGVGLNAGQVFLNPQFFHVHKKWTFINGQNLAGDYTQAQKQLSKSAWRKNFTLYPRKLLMNGRGDFDPGTQVTWRNDAQLYVLFFSDNTSLDAQSPTVTANCLLTVKS